MKAMGLLAGVGLCLVLLIGCGAWGMDRELYDAVHRANGGNGAAGPASPAGPRQPGDAPPANPDNESDSSLLPAAPTADDYVRVALARNPSIQAAKEKVRRLSQRIVQEASLDDPMLMVAPVGRMPEDGRAMYGVKQMFPAPGKLNARGRIAAREAGMAEAELARTRLAVEADTRTAFWSCYYADAAIRITEADRDVLKQMRDTADVRLRAGTADQQDVLRANVDLANLDRDLLTLRQEKKTAQAMLNSLLNRPVTAELPVPAKVEPDLTSFELEPLMAAAAQSNPELAGLNQQIEMFRQQLRLAKLKRLPDLTVGLNYNSMKMGPDEWWVQFELNLPIWLDKLSAGEGEARAGTLEASGLYDDARNRVMFRIQDALARVQAQQKLLALFGEVIIPQARQALEASFTGYRSGKLDFLTLSENRRKLLEYQVLYQRSLAQLGKDQADLRREIGGELPTSARPAGTPPGEGRTLSPRTTPFPATQGESGF